MLDEIPQILGTVSTLGLALLGGHVALSPPREDQKALKTVYLASFIILAVSRNWC